jgi:hypothetical protein
MYRCTLRLCDLIRHLRPFAEALARGQVWLRSDHVDLTLTRSAWYVHVHQSLVVMHPVKQYQQSTLQAARHRTPPRHIRHPRCRHEPHLRDEHAATGIHVRSIEDDRVAMTVLEIWNRNWRHTRDTRHDAAASSQM